MHDAFSEIEVEQDAYASASPSERLSTLGLGPCIGIGIIDHVNKRGHLLHSSNVVDGSILSDFLAEVDASSSRLEVHLAGGDTSEEDSREDVLAARTHVVQTLKERFPSSTLLEKWNPEGETAEMIVDPEAALIKVVCRRL